LALIVQFPVDTNVTVVTETVQTEAVLDVNPTARPEDAVAVTSTVFDPNNWVRGAGTTDLPTLVNVIV
jgi:hypothetical protein